MALQTLTATRIGRRTSVIRAAGVTPGASGTVDTMRILHGLGVSPDAIVPTFRTLDGNATLDAPVVLVQSWDATNAIVAVRQGTNTAASGTIDVLVQAFHSYVA